MGDNSRGPYINASLWVLQALSGTFLSLRVYCKLIRRRCLWWDDCLLITSWIFLLVSAAATTWNVHIGFGKHFSQVKSEDLELLGILSILSGFFSILSSVTSKTSFAVTLLRLSSGWLKRFIWGMIVSFYVLMPISAIFLFVSCNPPAKHWKPYLPGKCWPAKVTVSFGIAVGSYSAVCDLALALLPWKILMRFRMFRREKIGVAIAMSIGVFACATAIVKCVMLPLLGGADFTFDGAPFVVWGFAESAVSIMAASIPAMRALFSEVRGKHRAISSLAISLATKPPGDSNSTSATAPDARSPANEKTDYPSGAPLSGQMPQRPEPSYDQKRHDSDKSMVEREGVWVFTEVTVTKSNETRISNGDQEIEVGSQRDSYHLQGL